MASRYMGKVLGLSPFDIDLINLVFGSSYPMAYGELGFMLSSMWGKLPEPVFRPRFFSMCSRGLVGFQSWGQMGQDIRTRKVMEYPAGVQSIRDIGAMGPGKDDPTAYNFFKYFDPYQDYSKNPSALDKFTRGPKYALPKQKQRPTRRQILDPKWRAAHGIGAMPDEVKNKRVIKYI